MYLDIPGSNWLCLVMPGYTYLIYLNPNKKCCIQIYLRGNILDVVVYEGVMVVVGGRDKLGDTLV